MAATSLIHKNREKDQIKNSKHVSLTVLESRLEIEIEENYQIVKTSFK